MTWRVGDAVAIGTGEDRETGKVKRLDPARGVLVAWTCGAQIWHQPGELHPTPA